MQDTFMRAAIVVIIVAAASSLLTAQETKPVPKDSVRVAIPGCTKGYIFTSAPRTVDEPGAFEIPEGMHLRMNGPKKLMSEIKAHEGSLVEITGLMKKGQYREGVRIGGNVTIMPGAGSNGGTMPISPVAGQIQIDVEGWRPLAGSCRSS
jgi:hypothetical protein